jgi:hypothetical protein
MFPALIGGLYDEPLKWIDTPLGLVSVPHLSWLESSSGGAAFSSADSGRVTMHDLNDVLKGQARRPDRGYVVVDGKPARYKRPRFRQPERQPLTGTHHPLRSVS